MPGRKKPFINKKTDKYVTYKLIPTGQGDSEFMDPEKRREEQKKLSVFFEDDYNYLQHLKERSVTLGELSDGAKKLSNFGESEECQVFQIFSEPTGPIDSEVKEVLTALDNEETMEEDDEFFDMLVHDIPLVKPEDSTAVDLSKRCQKLRIIDEQFEKYMEKNAADDDEFCDDDDSGDYDSDDDDERDGWDNERLKKVLEEEEESNQPVLLKDFAEQPLDKEKIKERFMYDSDTSDEEREEVIEEVDPLEGLDCQSFILSRASTKTFTPTIIEIVPRKPKKKKKEELPEEMEEEEEEEEEDEKVKPITVRKKDESAEEKRLRKQTVKEHRRERREEKSMKRKIFNSVLIDKKIEKVNKKQIHQGTRLE